MAGKPQPISPRFWRRVDRRCPDECWPWTGSAMVRGYGVLSVNGRYVGTHRVSWEMHVGPIPDGMLVCHHCDNPPCVNPAHLFLGTYADNNRDKTAKGRNPGNRTASRRTPPKRQPLQVLELRRQGMTYKQIGERLGIAPSTAFRTEQRA